MLQHTHKLVVAYISSFFTSSPCHIDRPGIAENIHQAGFGLLPRLTFGRQSHTRSNPLSSPVSAVENPSAAGS